MTSYNLNQNLANLSTAERNQLFQVCNTHAILFAKLIPNVPLLEYITTGTTAGADSNILIQQYQAWKLNQ
jgi:hypothetical protein